MKKLLATLLVAAMLISCMSLVTFATSATFATVSSYPYPGMDSFTSGMFGTTFNDTGFAYLVSNQSSSGAVAYFASNSYSLTGYVPSASDLVTIPLNITSNSGIGLVKANISFDANLFEYVDVISAWGGSFTGETLSAGNVAGGGMLSKDESAENVTALSFVLRVKSDAVGDANGNATTTITFSNAKVVFSGENSESSGSITTPSLTINLTGLTPGAAETPEEIADAAGVAEAMPAAAVKAFSATDSAIEDAAWLDTNSAKVVKGDGEDVDLTDGNYQVTFGTADFTGKVAPVEYGFALYANDELKGYYAAKSVVEGKFGILFFGLKDGVTYTTKSYVKYDGEDPIVAAD